MAKRTHSNKKQNNKRSLPQEESDENEMDELLDETSLTSTLLVLDDIVRSFNKKLLW